MLIKKGAVWLLFLLPKFAEIFSTDLKPLPQTVRLEG